MVPPPNFNLRKALDFNDPDATSRYLCVLLAALWHKSILLDGMTPEKAFLRVENIVTNNPNVRERGVEITRDEEGNLWISHEPDKTYIVAYETGEFGPKSKEEFIASTGKAGEETLLSFEEIKFDPLGRGETEHLTEQVYSCEMPGFDSVKVSYQKAIRPSKNYTELLACSVNSIVKERFDGRAIQGLEIGTGCGLASILVASSFESLIATDIDIEILEEAKRNLTKNHISNVELVLADLFEPFRGGQFDLIFVAPPQKATFAERVEDKSRDAGISGREFINKLIAETGEHLKQGGHLIFVQNSVLGMEETLEEMERSGFKAQVVDFIKIFPSGETLEYFKRLADIRGEELLKENDHEYYLVYVFSGEKRILTDPTIDLKNLQEKTIVFFIGEELKKEENREKFKKALCPEYLGIRNRPVVLVEREDEIDEMTMFINADLGIDTEYFEVATFEDVGLDPTRVKKYLHNIIDISNLQCIPLIDSLCDTYDDLRKARDKVTKG